jgi:hypothetical protein
MLLLTAALLASCASLGGLTDGPGDAGRDGSGGQRTDGALQKDGGRDGGRESGRDSGRDGGRDGGGDAQTLPDVSNANDSPSPGDAALHWCKTQPAHTFCADFDEPLFITQWSSTEITDGGTLGQDDAESVSPPFGLRANIANPYTNHNSYALLEKQFSATPGVLRVAFDLRVDKGCDTGFDVVGIFLKPSQNFIVYLGGSPTALNMKEAAPGDGGEVYGPVFPPAVVPVGAWVHVDTTLTFGTEATSRATFTIADAGFAPIVFPLPMDVVDSGVQIKVGAANYSSAPFGNCEVHIDDLTVDLQ